MRLFITGDLHGQLEVKRLNSKNWPLGRSLTKEDILIIAGDFGLTFFGDETENFWLDWLEKKPWTTLFIDGNHENFPLLRSYPETELYGGPVGVLRPSVLHLKRRGHVYNIASKKVWCFGGGYSIDKADRTPGYSWWSEEEADNKEIAYAQETLENCGDVDFALTHDAPLSLLHEIYKGNLIRTRTAQFLDLACDLINTRTWYFAHHHIDASYHHRGKYFRAFYQDIAEIPV